MSDTTPAKQSKCNLSSDSKPPNDLRILESVRTTKLLDLNEDCLYEVFRHLSVVDLCYVSRVCTQLQQLAKSYFKRKYSDFDFSTWFQGRLMSNRKARVVLSTFGPLITSMNIEIQAFHIHCAAAHVGERILKTVARYCKELDTLTLTGFSFTSEAVEALNLLSGSLKTLTLDGSVSADCVFHLINFSSLQHLTVTYNYGDCYALMDTFPNLKTLTLINGSIPIHNLHHFIVRHGQLKALTIRKSNRVSSAVARFAAKYLKSLRTFFFEVKSINQSESLEDIQENFLQLNTLRNLEYLALYCNNMSIGNLVAKMVANKIVLKGLHIADGLNDAQTTEAIVQMKSLEDLTLYRMKGLNGEHLIKCAKELARLKELSIWLVQDITDVTLQELLRHTKQLALLRIYKSNLRLDSESYNDILDTVKERRNGTKLEINFRRAGVQIMVPQRTIQANENWLIINQGN